MHSKFLKLYVRFWQTCWRDPWWYVAVFLYSFGPFLSVVINGNPLPLFMYFYVPTVAVLISVTVVLDKLCDDRKNSEKF